MYFKRLILLICFCLLGLVGYSQSIDIDSIYPAPYDSSKLFCRFSINNITGSSFYIDKKQVDSLSRSLIWFDQHTANPGFFYNCIVSGLSIDINNVEGVKFFNYQPYITLTDSAYMLAASEDNFLKFNDAIYSEKGQLIEVRPRQKIAINAILTEEYVNAFFLNGLTDIQRRQANLELVVKINLRKTRQSPAQPVFLKSRSPKLNVIWSR